MAIKTSREGGVGFITLDTPPANAYNKPLLLEFQRAVDTMRNDDQVRCVVVNSAMEKFFCAGADITVLNGNTAQGFADFLMVAHEAMAMIEATPKIFIAAIKGHCMGGGLELALACDLRFASEGKYGMGLVEAALGLSPGMGGTQRLARRLPKSTALHLMITAEVFQPEKALELGVIDRLFPADKFQDEVMAYANKLASGPSLAHGLIKLAVNQGVDSSLTTGLAIERALQASLFTSEDAAEGIKAFLEKRKPAFKGK
ncbi:MAG: enoyl-CoA hydratase/isomerase family protein [Alphaproteobacteria bacterium]